MSKKSARVDNEGQTGDKEVKNPSMIDCSNKPTMHHSKVPSSHSMRSKDQKSLRSNQERRIISNEQSAQKQQPPPMNSDKPGGDTNEA